ncbi:uncharacterized protein HKW66_Vig0032140 [Vigna angularis]|uniref:Uncharacterized protein n=1 Tax=Phaseolus angularis TaxID=3914 RepID=A0A8T0L9Y5_PHAAN|nr:uncharacterized protein HKW66_Vig0032140 [Vigna angularis]
MDDSSERVMFYGYIEHPRNTIKTPLRTRNSKLGAAAVTMPGSSRPPPSSLLGSTFLQAQIASLLSRPRTKLLTSLFVSVGDFHWSFDSVLPLQRENGKE